MPHTQTPSLYPAQLEVVNNLTVNAGMRLRHTLVAQTGCGKTAMAIRIAKRIGAERILVVCPAIVRYHWAGEFLKWAQRWDVGVIEMGRTRVSGTKKALLCRDWAYEQPVQIVSYDLLKHIDIEHGWDMLIIDELHNLGEATSAQSRLMRHFVNRLPYLDILGLTATPIPTHPTQMWYPQWLMHGNTWGKPKKNGGLSHAFAARYFEISSNDYSTFVIGALREDRKSELLDKMSKNASFLNRFDIADDLPPLDARPLYVGARIDYADWLRGLGEDITHAIILTHHRAEARRVCEQLNASFYIDGSMLPGERVRTLEDAASQPRALVVATQDSLSEGIRLMWVQRVLVAEFSRSPGRITQLLGRFTSVGDVRRPQIDIAITDSDNEYVQLLTERISDVNAVLRQTNVPAVISKVFEPRPLTDTRLKNLFSKMLASARDTEWYEAEHE